MIALWVRSPRLPWCQPVGRHRRTRRQHGRNAS